MYNGNVTDPIVITPPAVDSLIYSSPLLFDKFCPWYFGDYGRCLADAVSSSQQPLAVGDTAAGEDHYPQLSLE